MSAAPAELVDELAGLDFDPEAPCDSRRCADRAEGPHMAAWYCLLECGCVRPLCDPCRVYYQCGVAGGHFICCRACGHPHTKILRWEPIR